MQPLKQNRTAIKSLHKKVIFKNPEKETWCKERRHLKGLINADFPSQERSFIASISRSNKGTVRQAAIASERKIKAAQSDYFS